MYKRSQENNPLILEFVLDDWLAVLLKYQEVAEILKELLIMARELNIRLWLIFHTTRGKAIGFDRVSDLAETFLDVYLGKFVCKYALAIRKLQRKRSSEWYYWNQIVKLSKEQSNCFAMVEDTPAVVPNLDDWRRLNQELIPDLMSTNQLSIGGIKVQGFSAEVNEIIEVSSSELKVACTKILREIESGEVMRVRGINGVYIAPNSLKSLVLKLHREKFSKEKIIKTICNVSKGGDKCC